MFTGIIEEVGKVAQIHKKGQFAQLKITANTLFNDIHLGDSIAVNGVCLTVTEFSANHFCADVMEETLKRSSLGELQPNSPVNLERAMIVNGRFGGHIVSGHIDGTGVIHHITSGNNCTYYQIKTSPKLMRYIIEKGSITIDGISLTIIDCDDTTFSLSVIPHTISHTNLATKQRGSIVNIENDIIGKYVEKLLLSQTTQRNITEDFMEKVGF
ncbi:riboflavin synthase [Pasteurella atlantica]|uniref:Riboflavin synthase n=2 Tax=Pasteurellaceae TaxID=712 RepID=A0ACC6HMZ8_9PAST|nr:riboflavin synthase [Pasteurella atlantica]MDP8052178.1 riboflavin synthase [Pasteurella atlantica]MDP8101221.1 riboflavin synthase [Pasteurella atlantica]MDP8105069.1 riboflavin synthase [Pasteurella atlantica]MDP8148554.1 riboflavin synthase [Pasteurella atlantica]